MIVMGRASTVDETQESSNIIYWLLLFATPLVISLGDFKTSKIQQAGVMPIFIPWWSFFFCMVIFGALFLSSDAYFPTSIAFWIVATLLTGIVSTLAWILKMVAFKYDKVHRITPIFYIESVFGLLLDYFVFNVNFSVTQLGGILLVFTMFAIKFYYTI